MYLYRGTNCVCLMRKSHWLCWWWISDQFHLEGEFKSHLHSSLWRGDWCCWFRPVSVLMLFCLFKGYYLIKSNYWSVYGALGSELLQGCVGWSLWVPLAKLCCKWNSHFVVGEEQNSHLVCWGQEFTLLIYLSLTFKSGTPKDIQLMVILKKEMLLWCTANCKHGA